MNADVNINVTVFNAANGRYSIIRRKPSLRNGDGVEAFLANWDTSGRAWLYDGGRGAQSGPLVPPLAVPPPPPAPLVGGQIQGSPPAVVNLNAGLGLDAPGLGLPNPPAFTPAVEHGKAVVRKEYDIKLRFLTYLYDNTLAPNPHVATVEWGVDVIASISIAPNGALAQQAIFTRTPEDIYLVGNPPDAGAIAAKNFILAGVKR